MAYRILTAAALFVALAAPALADDVIRPNGPPITLLPSAGTLMKTAAPVGNAFIANPEIASIQLPMEVGRDLIYIFAKKPGKTTLYALGEDGNVLLSRVVDVAGPRTVRVLHGKQEQIWSEQHGEPTGSGANLADLPPGSTVSVPVGGQR